MNREQGRWRWLGLLGVVVLAFGLFAAACKDDDDDDGGEPTTAETPMTTAEGTPAETPAVGTAGQLDITAVEFSYRDVPAGQPGGMTTITMNNAGAEPHQAQFVKLNEGVTFEQFQTAVQADESGAQALAVSTVGGGVNAIAAGATGEVTQELDEGTYVMLCFVSGDDDVPHVAKGMITQFEVTAPEAEQPEPPTSDATITLADFSFTAPETVTAGPHVIEVVNSGPSPHEMTMEKLPEGMTVEAFTALLQSEDPPPEGTEEPTPAGGMGAIPANATAFTSVDLETGTYVLLCFVPDDTGTPHAFLGMIGGFTVE